MAGAGYTSDPDHKGLKKAYKSLKDYQKTADKAFGLKGRHAECLEKANDALKDELLSTRLQGITGNLSFDRTTRDRRQRFVLVSYQQRGGVRGCLKEGGEEAGSDQIWRWVEMSGLFGDGPLMQ